MRLWVSRVAIGMNKGLEFVITPVSGAIGADVSGIDVSGPLDQKIVTALNDAFLGYFRRFRPMYILVQQPSSALQRNGRTR